MISPPGALVVDTSVAVKWFLREGEEDVTRALALQERHVNEEVTLCAPSLLLWELGNVLKNKPGTTPSTTVSALQSTVDLKVRLFEPSLLLLRRAVSLAYEVGITVYDAAFLALASELGCPFITADRRLAGKIHSGDVKLLSEL